MTSLSDHSSSKTTKLLLIGDSGSGKTGALASLASEGYNLRILDFDNGLDILANMLKHPQSPYKPDSLSRVHYQTITDPMKVVANVQVPSKATVWPRAIKLLEDWKPSNGAGENLGPVTTWTPQDVLVIDSLTFLSKAALNFILYLNTRLGKRPFQSDWYDGQLLIEGLLEKLYDDGVQCNVIVISHITFIGEENGPLHGYPNTLGKALPPKVGRYFNSVLMMKTSGHGQNKKRKLLTNTSTVVELKNSAPLSVKAEYDVTFGLAEFFRDVRGEGTSSPQQRGEWTSSPQQIAGRGNVKALPAPKPK